MKRTLYLLILSDIFILSGFGLISPILAIFINTDLIGGSILAAGIAISIFWTIKSLLQLPLSMYIDTKRKKKGFLILGTCIISIVPFIYFFSKSVFHIYLAQTLYAMGAALAYPTWLSLFTINVDKKHRGFEWSVWSTCVGLGVGLSAFIGGNLTELIGFRNVALITGVLAIIGFSILFFIGKNNQDKINPNIMINQRRMKHLKK